METKILPTGLSAFEEKSNAQIQNHLHVSEQPKLVHVLGDSDRPHGRSPNLWLEMERALPHGVVRQGVRRKTWFLMLKE